MIWEMYYTFAARGLKPGSTGFCTVAATSGLPEALAGKLEVLSGYKELHGPHDAQFARNPVLWSHFCLTIQTRSFDVLSRVTPIALDTGGHVNRFAHHLVLEGEALPTEGPAALLQRGLFQAAWDGKVRTLLPRTSLPPEGPPTTGYRHWQALTGDAGWAGVLAEEFLQQPWRPVYLLYPPGTDLLPLLAEALALLPPERRWEVTFSTFYRFVPAGISCAWRGLPLEAPEAATVRRQQQNVRVLELTRSLGPAPAHRFAAMLRPWRQSAGETAAVLQPVAVDDPPTAVPPALEPAAASDGSERDTAVLPTETLTPPSPTRSRRPLALSFLAGTSAGIALAAIVAVLLWRAAAPRSSPPMSGQSDASKEKAARVQIEKLQRQLQQTSTQRDRDTAAFQERLAEAQTQLDRLGKELAQAQKVLAQKEEQLKKVEGERTRAQADAAARGRDQEAQAKVLRQALGLGPNDPLPGTGGLDAKTRTLLRQRWDELAHAEEPYKKSLETVRKDLQQYQRNLENWKKITARYDTPAKLSEYFKGFPARAASFQKENAAWAQAHPAMIKKLDAALEGTHSAAVAEQAAQVKSDVEALHKEWQQLEKVVKEALPK